VHVHRRAPRAEELRTSLRDERSGEVVLVSNCLLNQNTRYLGGAFRPGAVDELLDELRQRGCGISQMPCPEQRAWGGVLKRLLLPVYGARGSLRHRLRRPALWAVVRYTRFRYDRLARRVAQDVVDYRRSGFHVLGVIGVGGSPSCGVRATMDLDRSLEVLAACPVAAADRADLNERLLVGCRVAGEGLFIHALERQLARRRASVAFFEHDLLAEMRGVRQRVLPLT
jgi:predicted secreted protein